MAENMCAAKFDRNPFSSGFEFFIAKWTRANIVNFLFKLISTFSDFLKLTIKIFYGLLGLKQKSYFDY